MKRIKALLKFSVFTIGTIALYSAWWITSFFIPNQVYWRQLAFEYWCRLYVRLSGMQVEVIGTPPKAPFFLVSNHLSYTDIPALRSVVPCVFVAKKEIDTWPVAGRIVRDMGVIFIDRTNRRDIPRAGEQIIQRLSQGEGIFVFPEGTSTKGEDVLPFNSSFLEFAARSDIPVSYASISYRTEPGDPAPSEVVCWWDDISFLAHMIRLFTIDRYTAVINFGEEPLLNTDRKQLAAELRDEVRRRFTPVI